MTLDTSERHVRLTGGHNFRDLGGYRSADGRTVRWGRLFRSGKLSGLTASDVVRLADHGIRVVCDLRTPVERRREPSVPGVAPLHLGWDYDVGHGRLRELAGQPGVTPEQVHDALADAYAAMPWQFARPYADAIRRLVDGQLPLVFHCTAGKDRTGVLAALILRALDVPEADVVEDYLLTDRCLDVAALVASSPARDVQKGAGESSDGGAAGYGFLRQLDDRARAPLLSCHRDFLGRAMDAVRHRHGSVAGYLDEVLGIRADELTRLREHLLESRA